MQKMSIVVAKRVFTSPKKVVNVRFVIVNVFLVLNKMVLSFVIIAVTLL